MEETLRPEERLVVLCARTDTPPEAAISEGVDRTEDWDGFVETAKTHGVAPLVLDTLRRCCPDGPPEGVFETLRQRSQLVATQNLRLLREVARLSNAFDARGIRAIPYRGPIVAELAYGSVGRREFGDLDFLLAREDFPCAKSVLLEHGYETRYILESTSGLTDSQERAYTRFERDYPFRHESDPIEVELHWRIISQHFPTAIDLETVWDRRSDRSIAGATVPVLSPEDRLLMLCIHGTRHRWERLEWICDVAGYVNRHEIDWDRLVRRAAERHCERMVYLGLAVAAALFDPPLPEWIERSIEADSEIPELRAFVVDRLFEDEDRWNLDLRRYQARTLERYRDKARFWACWAMKPDRGDIETVSFPSTLVPLYSAVHLLRMGDAAIGRVTGRGRSIGRFRTGSGE